MGASPYDAFWSDSFSQLGATSPLIHMVTPANTTSYFVNVTDANGCNATSSNVTVTVTPFPSITLTADPSNVCTVNSSTLTATFSGTGPFDLTWSDGLVQTNQASPVMRIVSPVNTTTYFVTVTDVTGLRTTSNNVTVYGQMPLYN